MWCGITAGIGAVLWAYKGVAILITGNQPDHAFQIAPFFFGVSALTLVYSLIGELRRPKWLLVSLGWLAAAAGATAAVAHFAQNEDGLGDPGYLVNFLATMILFFLIGGQIRRSHLLPRWSFTPTFLAWALLLVIPLSAAFGGVDERLGEVPLVVVSAGWAMLAVAVLSGPQPDVAVQTGRT
jgi:hypothetical protein